MKYSVLWLPDAEAELTRLWNAGPDRSAIAAAADDIDVLLKTDPHKRGESRDAGERILINQPLAVLFYIIPDDMKVEVLSVWRSQRAP